MLTQTVRMISEIARGYLIPPRVTAKKTVDTVYRCWPIDADIYLHMNNSKFLQLAELSRWRTIHQFAPALKKQKGFLFLVAENNVKYLRPINIFQRYVISSSVCFHEKDDKWVYYEHRFEEHPDDVTKDSIGNASPKTFAVVNTKAVVKEGSGKTVKPSSVFEASTFLQQWAERK